MSDPLIIETADLRKNYDGAGKTTTIKILLGLAMATSGKARVFGLDADAQSKLSLLLALCRGAELLILDEPTSGLDPVVTEEVLQALVAGVAGEAMTVFFSSHQIAEVDQIADHVAIIDRGQVAISDALDDLRGNYRRIQLVFEGEAPNVRFHASGVRLVQRKGRVLTLLSSGGTEQVLDEARGYRYGVFGMMSGESYFRGGCGALGRTVNLTTATLSAGCYTAPRRTSRGRISDCG